MLVRVLLAGWQAADQPPGDTLHRMRPVCQMLGLGRISRRSPLRRIARGWLLSCCLLGSFSCSDKDSSRDSGSGAGGKSGTGGTASSVAGAAGFDSSAWGPLRLAASSAQKLLGAAVNAEALRSDSAYANLLAQQFDYVTPENATKWGPLAPTATSYAFVDADAIVDFAQAHGQAVKGHTLIWHKQLPSWVSDTMTADDLRAAMKNHIETTIKRYRGRVRAWDVVNEAIDTSTSSGYADSVFYRKLGPGYIEEAFRMARAADPDVLLHYNEVGIERIGPKSNFAFALLSDLLAKGVPIDGVGFQSHITMHRYPAESHLRANIRRFAALGLKVHISELDVKTVNVPGDQASRWQAQRVPFQQVVGICVDEPGCEGVTLWGVTDQYAWTGDNGVADEPLVFDQLYAPKPSYYGVLAGLGKELPTYGANLVAEGSFDAGGGSWTTTGGTLSVASATPRASMSACVSGRTAATNGLSQSMLQSLSGGGQFAFSAWAKVRGATTAPVDFAVTTLVDGSTVADASLGSITATDSDWIELAGNFGLGVANAPVAIDLKLYGPPASVDLCVTDVTLRAMTTP